MSISPFTPQQIDDTLADVRKAYRLLHDYQRSALDAIHHVATRLDGRHKGCFPCFSNAARAGKGGPDNWAWDWLNMVYCEMSYWRKIGERVQSFSFVLISDSGALAASRDDEPATAAFSSVEDSETLLAVIWCDGDRPDWRILKDFGRMKDFARKGGALPDDYEEEGRQIFGRCYEFARLVDLASADGLVDQIVRDSAATPCALTRPVRAQN